MKPSEQRARDREWREQDRRKLDDPELAEVSTDVVTDAPEEEEEEPNP